MVKSIDEISLLKLGINEIVNWCSENEMNLNVPTYNSMSFHHTIRI